MSDAVNETALQYRPWVTASDGSVRLLASVDKSTGRYFFPPLPPTSPQAERFETKPLAVEAVLYSHTTIYPSRKSGKQPFTLVYADFPEKCRVFGRLAADTSERPRIGSNLRVALESQADGSVDYAFVVRA